MYIVFTRYYNLVEIAKTEKQARYILNESDPTGEKGNFIQGPTRHDK